MVTVIYGDGGGGGDGDGDGEKDGDETSVLPGGRRRWWAGWRRGRRRRTVATAQAIGIWGTSITESNSRHEGGIPGA